MTVRVCACPGRSSFSWRKKDKTLFVRAALRARSVVLGGLFPEPNLSRGDSLKNYAGVRRLGRRLTLACDDLVDVLTDTRDELFEAVDGERDAVEVGGERRQARRRPVQEGPSLGFHRAPFSQSKARARVRGVCDRG